MSYEIPGFHISRNAVVNLEASQYRFVKLTGDILEAVTAVGDNAIGVLQNAPNKPGEGVFTPASGASGTVMIDGVTMVKCAAPIASGVVASFDAVGDVVAAPVGGKVVGITQSATGAAGDLVALLLKPLGGVEAPAV